MGCTPEFINDIAVLRLKRPVVPEETLRLNPDLILPICTGGRFEERGYLGFSGHGTPSGLYNDSHTRYPYELNFLESDFASRSKHEMCRMDNVCVVQNFPVEGSNICFNDDGSPLFALHDCGNFYTPKCLYGIASYFRNSSNWVCDNGSFFTNIPYFSNWINEFLNPNLV